MWGEAVLQDSCDCLWTCRPHVASCRKNRMKFYLMWHDVMTSVHVRCFWREVWRMDEEKAVETVQWMTPFIVKITWFRIWRCLNDYVLSIYCPLKRNTKLMQLIQWRWFSFYKALTHPISVFTWTFWRVPNFFRKLSADNNPFWFCGWCFDIIRL